jgi:hypothetical protein
MPLAAKRDTYIDIGPESAQGYQMPSLPRRSVNNLYIVVGMESAHR